MNTYTKYGIALAWAAVAVAYYVRVPEFRETVNTKWHWVKDRATPGQTAKASAPLPPATELKATPIEEVAPRPAPLPEPVAVVRAPEAPPATPTPEPEHTQRDLLQELTNNRAAWPPTVRLKSTVSFPAVLNGKVVGRLNLAKDSVVTLVKISQGKLGLEHRGGGAWVNPEQTDLLDKLLPPAPQLRGVAANAAP